VQKVHSILALAAHPDDLELGCGATLAKLAARGAAIRAVVLSDGGRGGAPDRCAESLAALESLGVQEVVCHRFQDTRFHENLNGLIECLERHVAEVSPDRVYTMFDGDRHQDHRTVYEASAVACRGVPQLLGYETPSSYPNFVPRVFEPVDDYMDRKVAAIKMHTSQEARLYMQEVKIRAAAHFRGVQVDLGQTEGFIPYKLIF